MTSPIKLPARFRLDGIKYIATGYIQPTGRAGHKVRHARFECVCVQPGHPIGNHRIIERDVIAALEETP